MFSFRAGPDRTGCELDRDIGMCTDILEDGVKRRLIGHR
jgi:hypothetical protein